MPRLPPLPLLLLAAALLQPASCQLQNPDAGKASVRLSLLSNGNRERQAGKAWPSEQMFERVDVTVLGKKVSETGTRAMMPLRHHMTEKNLRTMLKRRFDPAWMSIDEPSERNASSGAPVSDPRLLAQLDRLELGRIRDDLGREVAFNDRQVHLFKTWLMRLASCHVDYLWEDLGPLFWPRWVKRGVCNNAGSCSWPAGMRCRKSSERSLRVLRWLCTDNRETGDFSDPRLLKRSVRDRRNRRRQRRKKKKRKKMRRRQGRREQAESRGGKERKVRLIYARSGQAFQMPKRLWQRRRLAERLARSYMNYYCYWTEVAYSVVDRCDCNCSA